MKFKDKEAWKKGLANNTDFYGSAIYRYAERWADLMEEKLQAGAKLEDIAKQTSHDADTEGISGFMYGAAVSVLARCWDSGEELRRWHNLATQCKHEGYIANAKGAVLNPALMTFESKGGK